MTQPCSGLDGSLRLRLRDAGDIAEARRSHRLEARLDGQRFSRIHRTYIVNLDHVAAFQRQPDGRLLARLDDGASLPVSRTKAHEFRAVSR